MNPVKIVATIGPTTCNEDALLALLDAGMDIARLNGSHSNLDWHAQTIELIHRVSPAVPILFDVPGRKVRIGLLEHPLTLDAGESIALSGEPGHNGHPKVSVTDPDIHQRLAVGNVIIADEGNLRLTVTDITGPDVTCRADTDGELGSGKGIYLPNPSVSADLLSERDRNLISFAAQAGADFIGLSFAEKAAQVEAAREMVGRRGPGIISKIESQAALEHLAEIIQASDAIMIDRGDLSMETSPETVGLLQKNIMAEARRLSCPVIVATEMLQTMVDSRTPTKAEISDITNSVLDGATALMLSDETTVGKFPTEAVGFMRRVSDLAWENLQEQLEPSSDSTSDQVPEVMGEAIALICRHLDITKIVAVTISGYAARMVAAKMPRQPILAVSNDPSAVRKFHLFQRTKGIHVDIAFSRTNMEHIPQCLEELWRRGELVEEDLVLVTAVGYPRSGNRMNLIETHKVADLKESLGWTR